MIESQDDATHGGVGAVAASFVVNHSSAGASTHSNKRVFARNPNSLPLLIRVPWLLVWLLAYKTLFPESGLTSACHGGTRLL
jgi:hypothetical protein